MRQILQIRRNGRVSVLKGVFLAPLNNGGRADPLHDPMINGAVWAGIQQDIGDVIANGRVSCWVAQEPFLRRPRGPSFGLCDSNSMGEESCWIIRIHQESDWLPSRVAESGPNNQKTTCNTLIQCHVVQGQAAPCSTPRNQVSDHHKAGSQCRN